MPKTARNTVLINAPAELVWSVLTRAESIRQWDDVPETFTEESLSQGSVLEWEGAARLTVTAFEPERLLRLDYVSPKWNVESVGIAYEYSLAPSGEGVSLTLAVGDWDKAPDGKAGEYFEASEEFVSEAGAKIKALAEAKWAMA